MKPGLAAAWLGCLPMLALAGAAPPGDKADGDAPRGELVFKRYCVLCHGEKADGNGAAAKIYNPPPANLTLSPYSDDYKTRIIRDGGAAMGRSAAMPPWGKELDETQIRDLVAYLRRIRIGAQ
jgi:mono/diheme cytochrome c family protein